MMAGRLCALVLLILALSLPACIAAAEDLPIDLGSGASWQPLDFPKIPNHSTYTFVSEDGRPAIRVESNDSASGLVYGEALSTVDTPVLRWSWKAMDVLPGGNAAEKKGDDYPIRIYVLFPYEPDRVPFFERAQFAIAKALYGEYPPAETLNYVWANRPRSEPFLPNAFTDRAVMLFPDAGSDHLGEWRTHAVNIHDDYVRVFGREPPDTYTIAIMGDSDNTHGSTLAYVADLSVGGAR